MLDFCVKLRSRCLIICFHWSAVAYDKDGILIDFYVGWRLQELIWNGKSPPQPVWHFLFCCSEYRILDFRHPRAYEYPIHRNTFSYCHLQHRDERRVQSSSRSFFSYWKWPAAHLAMNLTKYFIKIRSTSRHSIAHCIHAKLYDFQHEWSKSFVDCISKLLINTILT